MSFVKPLVTKADRSCEGLCTAFLRWQALRDEGPNAEPFGKKRRARTTAFSETMQGSGTEDIGGETGEETGCLACISVITEGES